MGDKDREDIRTIHPIRPKDLKLFLPYLRPVIFKAVIGILLTALSTFLVTLLPLTSKVVIDFVIEKSGFERLEALLSKLGLSTLFPLLRDSLSDLKTLITILVAGGILIGLFNIAHRYLMVSVQQGITYNLQKGLFERILRFPFSFFRKEQSGYLLSRITDDINGIQYLFTDSISQVITRSVTLLFGIIILLGLNYRIALIVISTIPLYIILNTYFGRGIKRVSHKEREAQAVASREIQEVFAGMEVVKAHVKENEEGKRISGSLHNLMESRVKRLLLSTVSVHSVKAIQFIATLLVIWYGVAEIKKGRMTVGDYVAFTAYIIALSGAANSLSWVWLSLQPVFASLERLRSLLMITPELDEAERSKLIRPDGMRGNISFRNVTFGYKKDTPVLKNVDMEIPENSVTAISGRTGSGKTTLVNLILRFYTPWHGSIMIDGVDTRYIDPYYLREQIAVISQDIFLFNGTIRENIRYGRSTATDSEVYEAAMKAGLHDEIMGMPEGYDTVTGERGLNLSGGQRQRISIARAVLRKPKILVFDEPTSSLDKETEDKIKASLRDLFRGRTVIIISHRNSLLDLADRIYRVEGGTVRREK